MLCFWNMDAIIFWNLIEQLPTLTVMKEEQILISVFFSFFMLKFLFCLNVELSILWTSRNLLIFCFIRFFGYWFLSYKFFIFVSSYLKAIKTEHILELCLDQDFPKLAMTDIQGAMSSKGAMGSKIAIGGHEVII